MNASASKPLSSTLRENLAEVSRAQRELRRALKACRNCGGVSEFEWAAAVATSLAAASGAIRVECRRHSDAIGDHTGMPAGLP